jgi:hypothetical protein
MRVGVLLPGFLGVMECVKVMAMRQMRVEPSLLRLLGTMMLRSAAMMLGGGLVVLGGLLVMLGQHRLVHDHSPLRGRLARAGI